MRVADCSGNKSQPSVAATVIQFKTSSWEVSLPMLHLLTEAKLVVSAYTAVAPTSASGTNTPAPNAAAKCKKPENRNSGRKKGL